MFKTTALDSVANEYVDKNIGTSTPGTRLEADDRNIIQDELVAAVEGVGQALDPTGVIRDQIRLAMAAYGQAFHRSMFEYNDADQIDVGAAMYMCKDKYCFWTSILTSIAIAAPAINTWYYLYLDYSAITGGTEITNVELIWSTSTPTWNGTYRQWLNGDDRCIFAVRTDGSSNILEFFHVDDLIQFADEIVVESDTLLTTTFADATAFTMPDFARMALAWARWSYSDVSTSLHWRTNGQAGTAGHTLCHVGSSVTSTVAVFSPVTDSGHIIEFKEALSAANTYYLNQSGWYLPTGM